MKSQKIFISQKLLNYIQYGTYETFIELTVPIPKTLEENFQGLIKKQNFH